MSTQTGRPKSNNPMNDRLYIRITTQEKEVITKFAKERGYTLLELIRIGVKTVEKEK